MRTLGSGLGGGHQKTWLTRCVYNMLHSNSVEGKSNSRNPRHLEEKEVAAVVEVEVVVVVVVQVNLLVVTKVAMVVAMVEVTVVGVMMRDTVQDTGKDTVVMRDTEVTVHMVVKDMHPTEETLKPNHISWNVVKMTPVVM